MTSDVRTTLTTRTDAVRRLDGAPDVGRLGAGDVATGSFEVTTWNVRPTGTISGSDTATVNVPYSVIVSVSDPGDDTVESISIDWGDGNFSNGTSHVYTQAGTYTIELQVIDEDSVYIVGEKTVTVQ